MIGDIYSLFQLEIIFGHVKAVLLLGLYFSLHVDLMNSQYDEVDTISRTVIRE